MGPPDFAHLLNGVILEVKDEGKARKAREMNKREATKIAQGLILNHGVTEAEAFLTEVMMTREATPEDLKLIAQAARYQGARVRKMFGEDIDLSEFHSPAASPEPATKSPADRDVKAAVLRGRKARAESGEEVKSPRDLAAEAEAARPTFQITVAKRGGIEEIHRPGCADLKKSFKRGWASDREDWTLEVHDLGDLYREYWDCIADEQLGEGLYETLEEVWWAWRSEFKLMPCAGPVPEMAEPPARESGS